MTKEIASDGDAPTFKGLKLNKKAVSALEAMAYQGLSLHLAADRFGIRRDNLQRSFDRVNVRRAYNQIVDHIRSNAGQDAYLRMVELSQTSKSEHVKADANKWVAGVDGISPVQKVQGQHNLQVTFGGFDYGKPPTKDVTPSAEPDAS